MAGEFAILDYIKQNHLFFISSDNYHSIESMFYGYAITGNSFICGKQRPLEQVDVMTSGAFAQIWHDEKQIKITQNYFCGYGLFIYRKANFWAVANSLLYLLENLGKEYGYSINSDFRDLFICHNSIVPSITETMINEITELAAGQYIVIDTQTGALTIMAEPTNLFRHELFSQDAMQIIDGWQAKYESLARALLDSKFHIRIDLSGGKDSRAAFSTVRNLPLDADNVRVHSATHHQHYAEDFKIATAIANIYGFPLNKAVSVPSAQMSASDAIQKSLYAKIFITDEIGYTNEYLLRPMFGFTGQGGEIIRLFDDADENTYLSRINMPPLGKLDVNAGARRLLQRVFAYLRGQYGKFCNDGQLLFIYTCAKHYHMRNTAESMFCNKWLISPLFDTCFLQIKYTKDNLLKNDALHTLICSRYLPELNDLGFNLRRMMDAETLKNCMELNKQYPVAPQEQIDGWNFYLSEDFSTPLPSAQPSQQDGKSHVLELYSSELCRSFTSNHLDPSLHEFAAQQYAKSNFKPEKFITKVFALWTLERLKSGTTDPGRIAHPAREFFSLAQLLAEAFVQEDSEGSWEIWQKLRQQSPEDYHSLLDGIQLLLKNGLTAKAFENDLAAAFPDNPPLLLDLACVHLACTDSDGACAWLEAASAYATDASTAGRIAKLYLEAGDLANAEKYCAIALGKDDAQRYLWDLLLEIAEKQKDSKSSDRIRAVMRMRFPQETNNFVIPPLANSIMPNHSYKGRKPVTHKIINIISTRYFIDSARVTPFAKYYLASANIAENYLQKRSLLFMEYCYRSVIKQLGEEDIWVLLVDKQYQSFVCSTLPQLDSRVCFATESEHNAILKQQADHGQAVLVNTRLDNDDALACDYLEILKTIVFSTKAPSGLIVFPHGMQYCKISGLNTLLDSSPHFMSAFKFPGTDAIYNVLKYGPHNVIFKSSHRIFEILTALPMWLEIVHDGNQGNRILSYGSLKEPAAILRERFGVFIHGQAL